jgi:hypothetical protein
MLIPVNANALRIENVGKPLNVVNKANGPSVAFLPSLLGASEPTDQMVSVNLAPV